MSALIYFSLILSTQLAFSVGSLTLKCYVEDSPFLTKDPFGRIVPTKQLLKFDNLELKFLTVERSGLLFQSDKWEVSGLKPINLDNIDINYNTSVSRVSYNTDLVVRGPYKMRGSMFLIPIYGDGEAELIFKNIQLDMLVPFQVIQNHNGRKFFDLKSFSYKIDMQEGVLKFSNLYNGDKRQSDAMHYFINRIWKQVSLQFARGGWDLVADRIFNKLKHYLLTSPIRNFPLC